MFVKGSSIIASDGRILLSIDENNQDFVLNIWDRLYPQSLETVRVLYSKVVEWNNPTSPLYDYFFRIGGGVSFLELDELLEVFYEVQKKGC